MLDKDEIRKAVSKNYSGVALKGFAGSCCKGNCGCGNAHDIKESSLKSGYLESDLASVPQESNEVFYVFFDIDKTNLPIIIQKT